MKSIVTLITTFLASLLFLLPKLIFCQPPVEELLSKVWQFTMPTQIVETDRLGIETKEGQAIAERTFQFRVINIRKEDGSLIIKFLRWPVETITEGEMIKLSLKSKNSREAILNELLYMKNFESSLNVKNNEANYRYFLLSRTEFDTRCEERLPKKQFSLGAMTLPIKVRFAEKDGNGENNSYSSFTGDISLGLSFGMKRNYTKRFAVNYLAGFSLSAIPVSAETTKGFIQNESNQTAITWHLGVLAEIDNFQIGVFTGFDYLSGKIHKEWVYRNKPWLGIGIGFSFFNAKKTTDEQR